MAPLASTQSGGLRVARPLLVRLPRPRPHPPGAAALPDATSMAASSEDGLAERQAAVYVQAEASKADVDAAVLVLIVVVGAAAHRLQQAVGAGARMCAVAMEELWQAVVNTLERKLFYIPSFMIYHASWGSTTTAHGRRIKANVL